jgi:hypothetical protein
MKYFVGILFCALFFAWSSSLPAADWYVKAGSEGNGSKESPFGDIWNALDKATRGDVIHVAKGVYNGKGGCGHYSIKIPDLTIAGGYNDDFSERDPFKNLTVLERASDYKGDWTGLPEGIIAGVGGKDHSGLTVDGLVLNCFSRNRYTPEGSVMLKAPSYPGKAFEGSSPNIKILNCIIANPIGEGIYVAWAGKDNLVANTFIVNAIYAGVETRSTQPGGTVTVRNCALVFCWYYPSRGGGMGVFVGRQGKTVLEKNIIAFCQTEGGEAGYAVSNTFGSEDLVMKDNVLFQNQGGYYKYMDADKKNLLVWKPEELKALNADGEPFMLGGTGGNSDENPGFNPDQDYFDQFSSFVASEPGKLNMDTMNEWRRSVGLPLQAEAGSKRQNHGVAYPLAAVVPNLVSKLPERGVQIAGPFASYQSAAAPTASVDYAETAFALFQKDSAEVKTLAGKPVSFRAGMGAADLSTFPLKEFGRDNYECWKLNLPGEPETTMKCLRGYFLKGSQAAKDWAKISKKKADYAAEGLIIKGKAYYFGTDTYQYPVGIVVDEVKKP